ncbi:MAG TPA: DUF1552 domain-containing protein, partial [Polyangiaceae bacterium]|nr:DUF1552 domain-containing protein [Polyangiaceae bacterium]
MRAGRRGRLGRRHFLSALGAAGALVGVRAFADDVTSPALDRPGRPGPGSAAVGRSRSSGGPLRFVAVYAPHGRARELWEPRDGFDMRYPDAILKPLDDPESGKTSFRDRLVVLGGVDLSAGIKVGTSGHDGPRVILTGSGADGKNASLDQHLAVERGLGADTVHTSLVLGIGSDQTGIGDSISYGLGGTPLPKWIDPAQTFAELFGAPVTGDRSEQLARQRREGKSVLDVIRADLTRLASRVPDSQRTKMEQHWEAIRDIEKRLAGAERRCIAPVAAERTHFAHIGAHDGGAPSLDAITDLQIDMLARALACDLTRFATLMLGDLSRTHLFPDLPEDVHGDVAHRYDARGEKHAGTPESWKALAVQNRYSYAKVARLLTRLDEAGVLADTIVLVSSDMGDPARHSSRDVPTVI